MIQQFQLVLAPPTGVRIPQAWAYRLYGWLMAQLPADVGDALHLQGEHPIAHFLHFSPEKQALVWTVSLLNEAVRQSISPLLTSVKEIPLHELTLPVAEVLVSPAVSASELIRFVPAAKTAQSSFFCRPAPSSSPAAMLFFRRKRCFCKA